MIIAILGILDMIAGIIIVFGGGLAGNTYLMYFTLIIFLKALYSIGTALAAGFPFDILGWVDLLAAIMLLLTFWGIPLGIFAWIGALIAIKGIYSFVIGFMAH
ncbi:MAG: hypothetical protein ISS93_03000 [Candidatus Aenigmarchaeota archaeon]|nr:hypothetical protein [Candidatus Aenigmarchaeota archaeon]